MIRFSCTVCVFLAAALLLAGCTPTDVASPTSTPSVVVVNLTPAARPAASALNACDAALPGVQVEIEERFASQANGDLLVRLGVPESPPDFLAQIAIDELAVVLHPENPAASLTSNEIRSLFSGQVTDWQVYSGTEDRVEVWVPLSVDETRLAFDHHLMQGVSIVSDAGLAPDPEMMQQVITANPSAIGYLPVSWQAPGLHTILLGIQLPVLVAAEQAPQGPAAELVACLQAEIGQQALASIYP